jgi:hypothetical protein
MKPDKFLTVVTCYRTSHGLPPTVSVADPDRFGPDPDPTSENRPDPDLSK